MSVEQRERGPQAARAGERRLGDRRRLERRSGALARVFPGFVEADSPEEVARRDRSLRRLLAGADVIAVLVAIWLAIEIPHTNVLTPASLLVVPLVLVAGRLMGLYHRDEVVLAKTTSHEAPVLFHLATLYTLILFLGQDLFLEAPMQPWQGFALWAAFFFGTLGWRAVIRHLYIAETAPERCLVIADDEAVSRVAEVLALGSALNADVVVTVSPRELQDEATAFVRLAEHVRAHSVQRVIISSSELDSERLLALVRDLKGLGVKVSIKPRLLEVVGTAVEFERVRGDVFLGVRRFGLNRTDRLLKRGMDVAGSATLLVLSAPLLVAIAIAIKLGDRGPVFFRQERVGRGGRRFWMWKFRTMSADAEARKAELRARIGSEGLFKLTDDPRVTRVGGFLRRTSLDELPQLFNVLRGQMSLVGPRPLVVDEDTQVEGWHRRRLHLTPGMTGIWQVMGSRLPLHEMVALDYLYIVDWSLWKDIQILLQTAGFVLRRSGM